MCVSARTGAAPIGSLNTQRAACIAKNAFNWQQCANDFIEANVRNPFDPNAYLTSPYDVPPNAMNQDRVLCIFKLLSLYTPDEPYRQWLISTAAEFVRGAATDVHARCLSCMCSCHVQHTARARAHTRAGIGGADVSSIQTETR